jgi:Protein of unknown function (DUF3313)
MKTAVGLTAVMVLLVTGCSTTQRVTVRDEPGICAFLGEVCHELQPGAQRSVSMAIPQVRLLGTGYYAASGKYPFVGGAQAAVKATDAVTGQVLGAGVDRRVGGGALQTAAQWQWGDAENVIKAWSQLLADGMYGYTSGAKKP